MRPYRKSGSMARQASGQTTIRVSRLTLHKLEKLRVQRYGLWPSPSHDEMLYSLACELLSEEPEQ